MDQIELPTYLHQKGEYETRISKYPILFEITSFEKIGDIAYIKGWAGYTDHVHNRIFYLKYNTRTNQIKPCNYYYRLMCIDDDIDPKSAKEYKPMKDLYSFDNPAYVNAVDSIPYYTIFMFKDCLIIPQLIRNIWKGVLPHIIIPAKYYYNINEEPDLNIWDEEDSLVVTSEICNKYATYHTIEGAKTQFSVPIHLE